MKTETENKLTIKTAMEREAVSIADAYFSHFDVILNAAFVAYNLVIGIWLGCIARRDLK